MKSRQLVAEESSTLTTCGIKHLKANFDKTTVLWNWGKMGLRRGNKNSPSYLLEPQRRLQTSWNYF